MVASFDWIDAVGRPGQHHGQPRDHGPQTACVAVAVSGLAPVPRRLRNEAPFLAKMRLRQIGPKLPRNEVMPRRGITDSMVMPIFEVIGLVWLL